MLFNKPYTFEDGSNIQWANREGLLYTENGFTVIIWVDFGPGWFNSNRVIKTSSLYRWTTKPEGASDVIDAEHRNRIIARAQMFFSARRTKAIVEHDCEPTRATGCGEQRVFKPHAKVAPNDLVAVEAGIGVSIPADLRKWLLALGYGDLGDQLSFRKEWFARIESGELRGGAIFAQDELGNLYAFDSSHTGIYYFSRSEHVFARVAESFADFMQELARRNYQLTDWMDALETDRYDW